MAAYMTVYHPEREINEHDVARYMSLHPYFSTLKNVDTSLKGACSQLGGFFMTVLQFNDVPADERSTMHCIFDFAEPFDFKKFKPQLDYALSYWFRLNLIDRPEYEVLLGNPTMFMIDLYGIKVAQVTLDAMTVVHDTPAKTLH